MQNLLPDQKPEEVVILIIGFNIACHLHVSNFILKERLAEKEASECANHRDFVSHLHEYQLLRLEKLSIYMIENS